MKNLLNTILVLFAFVISIVLSSCCADNECAEEDIYGKTIVRQTDTLYNVNPKLVRGPFYVQIGAYANKSNADAFASDSKKQLRLTVTIKQTKDGIYRVIIGEYKTVEEADEVLTTIKRQGFSDSFVRDDAGPISK
ncbi:MAG: SPOR domain-containing protein [Ignavibacteria bacterium]|nr:SPOR domain-containing protein [Ignavibacteria bacterium]